MSRDARRVVEAKLRRRDREQGRLPAAFLDDGMFNMILLPLDQISSFPFSERLPKSLLFFDV